jgi:hypothetical protein
MVRVHFQNGGEALLHTATKIKGGHFPNSETPGIVCLDHEGQELGHFRNDQIVGYQIEPLGAHPGTV